MILETMTLETTAYGKINWSLKALGRFPAGHLNAGFTQIQSVVFKINLHDNVRVTINDQGSAITQIRVTDPRVPQDRNEPQKNSAYRAAELFRSQFAAASRADISIEIEKKLPVAGGLGGSSTDAAAVLKLLFEKFSPNTDLAEQLKLAAKLGSDVPLFVAPYSACSIEGRGEIVTAYQQPVPDYGLVLVFPGILLESRDVYAGLTQFSARQNDLEGSVYIQKHFPELEKIKSELVGSGCAGALMSGSGSTVFGYTSKDKTEQVCQKVRERLPEYKVITSSFIETEQQ